MDDLYIRLVRAIDRRRWRLLALCCALIAQKVGKRPVVQLSLFGEEIHDA